MIPPLISRQSSVGHHLMALGMIVMLASLCLSLVLIHIGMAIGVAGCLLARPAIWRLPGFPVALAFAAWQILASVVMHLQGVQTMWHTKYGTAFTWLALYVGAVGLSDLRTRRWALHVTLLSVTMSLIVASLQFFVGNGSVKPFRIDSHGVRGEYSRGFHPLHLTQGFVMTHLFLLYLIPGSLSGMRDRWLWLGRIMTATAVMLANSRAGILALMASFGGFRLAKQGLGWRVLVFVFGAILMLLGWVWFITPEKITRVLSMQDGRLIIWRTSVEVIARNPWFGVGESGEFKRQNEIIIKELYPDGSQDEWITAPDAHNIILGLASSQGIPALVLYFVLLAVVMAHLHQRRHENPTGWQLGCGATAAMLVGGMFEHYAGHSVPSYAFFATLGMALALDRKYLEEAGVIERSVATPMAS